MLVANHRVQLFTEVRGNFSMLPSYKSTNTNTLYSARTNPAEYESETGGSVGVLGVGLIQI